MAPPKRKDTGTPEKAESSTKRQALTVPDQLFERISSQ